MFDFLAAVFPEYCVRCREEGSLFCPSCRAAWAPTPINHDQIFSIGSYKDQVLQSLIGLWKYHYVDRAGEMLMQIVALAARDYRHTLPPVDAVTFIPLHRRKRNARGFDQAERIATELAQALGVPCLALMERIKYTAQQAQIERAKRQATEFTGVFCSRATSPRRVLLVDDVATTGSTFEAARAILLSSGATSVSGFTLARG